MRTATRERIAWPAVILAANKRFGRYGTEHEHIVRKAEVKKDPAVEGLKELYRKTKALDSENEDSIHDRMVYSLKNHSHSAADIQQFSIALAEFQEEIWFFINAGLFLSALMNNGKDNNYVIHTRHLSVPIIHLGYKNTKNITVKGDVGNTVGYSMEKGLITVKGDADAWIGYKMNGGTICVEGDAGTAVGTWMNGGEIHIEGEICGSTSTLITHGKIYHKGKLIVDK